MPTPEHDHVDVLIVGAGISGIGCAYHLQAKQPGRTYAILEARDALGGTWDLFRFPGIRSDSDLQTLGYAFKPWTGEKAIADGPAILDYVRETAAENDIERHIRFGHRVVRAEWSTADARWTVHAQRTDTGEDVDAHRVVAVLRRPATTTTTRATRPQFEGRERFAGTIVHPQHWPEDLDYTGKRVVVIGSGATAVTIVPGDDRPRRARDDAAALAVLHPLDPVQGRDRQRAAARCSATAAAYDLARRKNIWMQAKVYSLSRRRPRLMKRIIRAGVRRQLPDGYPVDTHFQPALRPVGPAPVRRARRRPVQGDQQRPRVGRHRRDRDVHRARAEARLRAPSSRPTSSSPRPG